MKTFVVTRGDIEAANRAMAHRDEGDRSCCCPIFQCLTRRGVPVLKVWTLTIDAKDPEDPVLIPKDAVSWIRRADDHRRKTGRWPTTMAGLRFQLDV